MMGAINFTKRLSVEGEIWKIRKNSGVVDHAIN